MSALFDVWPRVLARRAGRAQRITSTLQVAIRRDALVICPLVMAGEDATVHIVALGSIGQSARVRFVPDPRYRSDQYELFARLGQELGIYFEACRTQGTYPQLWVSSGAAVELLDLLAERLRNSVADAKVRRFGHLLSYCTDRFPIAGQQTLHTATGTLRRHFATGQDETEDEHLGALLTWIAPPKGKTIDQAVLESEAVPAGIKTDPMFDGETLLPLIAAYNDARRQGAPPIVLRTRARAIEQVLTPVVTRIYRGTQRAIQELEKLGLPLLADLGEMEERETAEYLRFMQSMDAGYRIARKDSAKAAAFKLASREDALDNVEAAVRLGDQVARARAKLGGDVLEGTVAMPEQVRVGKRRFDYRFDLLTEQVVLRVRQRDELVWADDRRLRVEVMGVQRSGVTTRVALRIKKGQRRVGLSAEGAMLELVAGVPEWDRLGRERGHLKVRLETTPWTHSEAPMPTLTPPSVPMPADLLAELEALQ